MEGGVFLYQLCPRLVKGSQAFKVCATNIRVWSGEPPERSASGTPWFSGCPDTDWYCLMQSLPLRRNLPVLSMLCAQPNARPFLCISLFTPGHS